MSNLEKQMRHRDKEMVPKILVQGMFALMVGSLALVAYAQWAGVPKVGVLEVAAVVDARRENGNIAIIDPNTHLSIDLIGYGKDNVAAFENLLSQAH